MGAFEELQITLSQLTLRSWGMVNTLDVLSNLYGVGITDIMVAKVFDAQTLGSGSH